MATKFYKCAHCGNVIVIRGAKRNVMLPSLYKSACVFDI